MTHPIPRKDFLALCLSGAAAISVLRLDAAGAQSAAVSTLRAGGQHQERAEPTQDMRRSAGNRGPHSGQVTRNSRNTGN